MSAQSSLIEATGRGVEARSLFCYGTTKSCVCVHICLSVSKKGSSVMRRSTGHLLLLQNTGSQKNKKNKHTRHPVPSVNQIFVPHLKAHKAWWHGCGVSDADSKLNRKCMVLLWDVDKIPKLRSCCRAAVEELQMRGHLNGTTDAPSQRTEELRPPPPPPCRQRQTSLLIIALVS